MTLGNAALAPRKSTARSRVSNGSDLLPGIDGRSATARRYRDICGAILVDQGGIDQCSESRKQLVRRFAAAAVLAENLEAALARGEDIDINQHALLCSTLTRLAVRIGINRTPRDLTPTLSEYLHARALETPVGQLSQDLEGKLAPSDEERLPEPPRAEVESSP
jgi:hypothetical protein